MKKVFGGYLPGNPRETPVSERVENPRELLWVPDGRVPVLALQPVGYGRGFGLVDVQGYCPGVSYVYARVDVVPESQDGLDFPGELAPEHGYEPVVGACVVHRVSFCLQSGRGSCRRVVRGVGEYGQGGRPEHPGED